MFTFDIVTKKNGQNYMGIENILDLMDSRTNKQISIKEFLDLYWKYIEYYIEKDIYETLNGKVKQIFWEFFKLNQLFRKMGVLSFLVLASDKQLSSFDDYDFTFCGIDLLSTDFSESLLDGLADENLNSFGLCQSMDVANMILQKYDDKSQAYYPCWTYYIM